MKQLLILNYHDIFSSPSKEEHDVYAISLSEFQTHLSKIKELRIPIVGLEDWFNKPKKGLNVALTFDDGSISHHQYVYPLLKSHGITASFFPTVSNIGKEGHLTWDHLKELNRNGFEVGSHGFSHRRLNGLSENDLWIELSKSKYHLEKQLSTSITTFSLPYGVYNSSTLKMLKSVGYDISLSTSSLLNTKKNDFLFHRFNIQKSMSLDAFEQLLNIDEPTLKWRKTKSMIALCYNRILGIKNLLQANPL